MLYTCPLIVPISRMKRHPPGDWDTGAQPSEGTGVSVVLTAETLENLCVKACQGGRRGPCGLSPGRVMPVSVPLPEPRLPLSSNEEKNSTCHTKVPRRSLPSGYPVLSA